MRMFSRSSSAALLTLLLVGTAVLCDAPAVPILTLKTAGDLWQGQRIEFEVFTEHAPVDSVRYRLSWGVGQGDTLTGNYSVGDVATVTHRWPEAGTYEVKAQAVNPDDETEASDWSEPVVVSLTGNSAPEVVYAYMQPSGAQNAPIVFRASATDPDDDSVRIHFFFGDDKDSTSEWVASGETVTVSHVYTRSETVAAYCQAEDIKGAFSDPAPNPPWRLPVLEVGGMRWWWIHDFGGDNEGYPITSPVIAMYEGEEYVYVGADDEAGKMYGIRVSDGDERMRGSAGEPFGYGWIGDLVYNKYTGHLICCRDDGNIYVYGEGLGSPVWVWPDPDTLTELSWLTPAVSRTTIYTACRDSLYAIPDGPNQPPPNPPTTAINGGNPTWPPIIDDQGNVLLCTDSGYLHKWTGDLRSELLRVQVEPGAELYGPVFGAGAVMYVASQSGMVYALNPNGSPKWQTGPLPQSGESFVAVSPTHVFVASDNGNVYCLNPATGVEVWKSPDDPTRLGAFIATPILAANGYLYAQDDDDVLWCFDQATGVEIWRCECPDPYGTRARRDVDGPCLPPTITSTGDIIMIGASWGALYCIAGYDDGTLMNAPWPKYQYDRGNSGYWGGF